MTEHHRLHGRSSHYTDAEGNIVAKSDNDRAFAMWTLASAVGLALVVASFPSQNWLVVPGALLALFAVSQSHPYQQYTHWYGLIVAVMAIGGPLVHLLDAAEGPLGR